MMADLDATLRELADAHGIATDFWDWRGQRRDTPTETIVAVLAALGVDASSPESAAAALEAHRQAPWTRMLPHCLVTRQGRAAPLPVHVRHGDPVTVRIELETGEVRDDLPQLENWTPPQEFDGRPVGEASFQVPDDLPL